jgi:hypothetical protein
MRDTIRIPKTATDVVMHSKDNNGEERLVLPVTRYKNILNAPRMVTDLDTTITSPFVIYAESAEELSTDEIKELISGITY